MVASALDSRLRDHMISKGNLFTEGGSFGPILRIFDQKFELSLNKLTVRVDKGDLKSFELDDSDPFWSANGSSPFPKILADIGVELAKYKQDVDDMNRQIDSKESDVQDLIGNTKDLMSAVNSPPELTERKREVKERLLDSYYDIEIDMSTRGSIERSVPLSSLKGQGTKVDKLRLAIIYLLSSEATPHPDVEAVETALRELESNIVDWAEKLYGQSIRNEKSVFWWTTARTEKDSGGSDGGIAKSRVSPRDLASRFLMNCLDVPRYVMHCPPRTSKRSAWAIRFASKDLLSKSATANYDSYKI
ncbi:hypothetical protein ACLOJK_013341 [Asimina triloba]